MVGNMVWKGFWPANRAVSIESSQTCLSAEGQKDVAEKGQCFSGHGNYRHGGRTAEAVEALRRAAEEGMTDKAVCDELGISTRQFQRWRGELELLGKEAFPGNGRSRDQELAALKRELAQVKKERDFLKEAAAYFARQSK